VVEAIEKIERGLTCLFTPARCRASRKDWSNHKRA
jgi:hypothetical protein